MILICLKNKYLMEKQKLHKHQSKMGILSSSSYSKQKPNNISYHLKHESSFNEKLTELQNKLCFNIIYVC